MNRLIKCIAAIALVAVLIGLAVYFVAGGVSPAKKFMKEHPYTFESGKTLGKEKKKSYIQDKVGVVYTAYPDVEEEETKQTIEANLNQAKVQFSTFMKEQTDKELIPRLVYDYTTKQEERYCTLTLFYEIAALDKEGKGDSTITKEVTYYIDEDYSILGLDDVLGEDSEEKINLMLKTENRSTKDMECFKVEDDKLSLYWTDGEKVLSVKDVKHASLIDPTKPMIALTFDDGPGKYSRQFADLLAEYNGHGTFFVLGVNVPTFSESLKYVYEMCNEIGSHTQSHKNLNKLSKEEAQAELDNAAEAVNEAIGIKPTLVRPPFGYANDTVMNIINGPVIKWSVDTEDWMTRDAEKIKKEILENVQDGDIILLHEIYSTTYDALKMVLPELASQGYQFVTVSELMRQRGVEFTAQQIKSCRP